MKDKEQLKGEIRYAIRLTERTARFYRRIQAIGIFLFVLGSSAIIASVADDVPVWVVTTGSFLFAMAGSMLIALRPADKAAQNESDVKKYKKLMSRAINMDEKELAQALEDARTDDTQEIESLREIAYNDVVLELNQIVRMYKFLFHLYRRY